MSADRSQLEKDRALFVRRLLSRFPLDDPKARVVVQAWELRENGLTPAKLIDRLGGRWEAEYNARQDYYVFRRSASAARADDGARRAGGAVAQQGGELMSKLAD
jgi:hypothetical protein